LIRKGEIFMEVGKRKDSFLKSYPKLFN